MARRIPGASRSEQERWSFKPPTGVVTMKNLLKARLAPFGLTIADEKTHHTNRGARENDGTDARRRMTFLGFTIYRSKNRNQTAENRFGRAKAAMKAYPRL